VTVEPLLFSSFVPTLYPENDESKKIMRDVLCELTNRDKLSKECDAALSEFNSHPDNKNMDLVLFMDALEHVVKIFRIITTPLGNALLVGVGGSGRKSLTFLATHIATFENEMIEITKSYGVTEWKEDMKAMMQKSGIDEKNVVFLFSDTHIVQETFVEDVNNILNNGEIPNLFANIEDTTLVLEGMKEVTKGDASYKNMNDAELMASFI
jgi:dynein heavy chain